MAKKKLGYVELEWSCPVCDTRNPGSRRVCSGCGSPQPDDVNFEAPAQSELISDEGDVERAQSAPDIHCPYCDARNPANAQTCKQCGGDLAGGDQRETGQIVGSFGSSSAVQVICPACDTPNSASAATCVNCGAPLPRPQSEVGGKTKPKPAARASSAKSSGCLKIAIGLFVLAIIAFGIYIFFANRTDTSVGTVTGARWTRTVAIEGLVPVKQSAWEDEIPQGAVLGHCHQEVRRTSDEPEPTAREVCGTPYTVDKGTGYGEVVQDCVYQILDKMCDYTVNVWQQVDKAVEEGNDLRPIWPILALGADQREGEKSERYQCVFTANDETYVFSVRSLEQFSACLPGSRWNLDINTFNDVVGASPSQ